MRLTWFVRLLSVAMVLAGLTAAGVWSIRAGWADYQFRRRTVVGTEEAIALAPDNAEYCAQLAMLASDDDPPRARAALDRTILLNPLDSEAWITLGLRAEQEGDNAAARRFLLRAAGADRKFLPRWTLANYFFRQDDRTEFWFWAKNALEMVYADAQPLFRLCGRVEEDGKLVDRMGIRYPDLDAAYLSYLLGQKREDLIGPVLHRLVGDNREENVPLLVRACERLLDTARVDEAVDLWERLAEAGRVPRKTPAWNGQLLVNGNFTTAPTSRGLDWRVSGADGIGVSREGESQGLRITFSGSEPEDCEALGQWVPVGGNLPYELQFTYRTDGIRPHAGLVWLVTDASGTPLAEGPSLASESDVEQRLPLAAPPACRLVHVSLRYRRAAGTTRMEGFVVLREVAFGRAAQAPPMLGARVRK